MCNFFSCVSNGKGKVLFFTLEDIVKIMSEGNKQAYNFNSHTSIMSFYNIKGSEEDKWNKWEWNINKKELIVDSLVTIDDRVQVIKSIQDYLLNKDILFLQNLYNYNSGHHNSGHHNSGHLNSGHYNSGHRNSGDYNSGHLNSGDRNSGHYNSGDYNSGDYNSGDRNSGHYNSGDYNSGDYNSGDRNSGHWNTNEPYLRLFNKQSKLKQLDWINHPAYSICKKFTLTSFISFDVMSEEEKQRHPEYKTIGGYLKVNSYETACKIWWNKLSKKEKEIIQTIPNFNKKIFKEITGIEISNKKEK